MQMGAMNVSGIDVDIYIYYMAQMVGVLWLVDNRSVIFRYGPENFIRALWLVNELGNNILVMDRLGPLGSLTPVVALIFLREPYIWETQKL